ncbi:arsenate reductase ArsC [Massilia sp. CCM 9210]|uniref:arsenate reductase ArsC n=1 Tax=Massilia scottii TaxID=3057166 RepID=UPI002796DED4|nr:arsenate reductase ArsC [Massilia sp. CCM 9210]MDQ1818069.1 arsenate reductase ArsC [Massilia sp. CCM 9210]
MSEKVYNVLFLCSGNSARSVMAEALASTMGKGRFRGYSAGSFPSGQVNPYAIEQIAGTGYPLGQLRSKSWDEFATPDAPHMDFVITVCDNAAGEICPIWPGHPMSAHWGFQDPAAFAGAEEETRVVFQKIFRQIVSRMNVFLSLPLHMLEKNAIKRELDAIGASDHAV